MRKRIYLQYLLYQKNLLISELTQFKHESAIYILYIHNTHTHAHRVLDIVRTVSDPVKQW